jgi:hypothetical protein
VSPPVLLSPPALVHTDLGNGVFYLVVVDAAPRLMKYPLVVQDIIGQSFGYEALYCFL